MNQPHVRPRFGLLDYWVLFLLFGYILFGRAFAHLGVAPVYIGEVTLVAFFVFRGNAVFGPAVGSLVRPSFLSATIWCTYALLVYGLISVVRGLAAGHLRSVTLQNVVFNVYPLFLWIGLYVGRRHPDLLRRMVLPLAWLNGLYGLVYVVILDPLGLTVTVHIRSFSLFGQPGYNGLILVALVSLSGGFGRAWLPLLLNAFVFLALQSRAAWIAFLVCILIWTVLAGKLVHVAKLTVAIALLLVVGYALDVRLPSPQGRGEGELSVRALAGQVLAIFDPAGAQRNARSYDARVSTIEWRTSWWEAIWTKVHSRMDYTLFGPGYGYPIWDLHEESLEDFPLRTPHNVVMYALGYTGWVGLILFVLLQSALLAALWHIYQRTGFTFGICVWILANVQALFDPYFEQPQGAIVFFLLIGLSLSLNSQQPDQPDAPGKGRSTLAPSMW